MKSLVWVEESRAMAIVLDDSPEGDMVADGSVDGNNVISDNVDVEYLTDDPADVFVSEQNLKKSTSLEVVPLFSNAIIFQSCCRAS